MRAIDIDKERKRKTEIETSIREKERDAIRNFNRIVPTEMIALGCRMSVD